MDTIIHSIVIVVILALAGLLGTYTAKGIKYLKQLIVSKIGETNFNHALELAKGLYWILEEKYNMSGMGEAKRKEMEEILLNKFPNLTQEELDSINKSVWHNFNEEIFKDN